MFLISGEIMISVLDPKREVGLWHSMLTVSTSYQFFSSQRKGLCCAVMISSLSFKLVFNFCLQSVMNGMHVIYVPPSVLKNSPAMWLQMVTKHRGVRQSK